MPRSSSCQALAAAAAVSVLVLKGSFRRVEHVLLALSAIFVAYIVSGVLAQSRLGRPDCARSELEPD